MFGRNNKYAWILVAVLYASCWLLPIHDDMIGFDGAELAHKEFWRFLTTGVDIETWGDVFEAIFVSIGWMANELFVLAILALWKWPRVAVRVLVFSLGIMISWQLAFPKELPFLIGYWIWIAAVAIALWIVTLRLIEIEQIDLRTVLGDRFSQTLFLTPVLNAVVVGSSDLLA